MASDQSINSFVLRFVSTAPAGEDGEAGARQPAAWHGTVRHVQSDTEWRFTRWEDAVAFIARYVDIGPGAR